MSGRGLLRSGGLALLLLAGSSACVWKYGFAGGGFPPEIRTVAVLPFENQTFEPTLSSDINTAVREAMENRLGLRQASESQADAVVTGTITRYEPDVPIAYTGTEANQVQVTRRKLQIVVSIQILDRRNDKVLWERQSLSVDGDYQTPNEADGKRQALEKLTQQIVDGAQSQW